MRCCECHDLSPPVLLRSDAFDVRQLQGVFPRRELNRDQFARAFAVIFTVRSTGLAIGLFPDLARLVGDVK